uniref:Uncharacterized protein n=1 Tax=Arundo donax TaxID=35708 RepID=A0A0A8ZSF2_ARUDO
MLIKRTMGPGRLPICLITLLGWVSPKRWS